FARLERLLSDRLGKSLDPVATQYELPVDGKAAITALLGPAAASSAVDAPPAAKVESISAARDSLTRNLIGTIGLRRERRTVPQVLIAEDDPFFQRLIGGLYTKAFRMTIAKSGADALDLYIQS